MDYQEPASGETVFVDYGSGVALNNQLIFPATTPRHGDEVWVTDGSSAGMRRITDIAKTFYRDAVIDLMRFGDRVYFLYQAGAEAPVRLWYTDGTKAGTIQVDGYEGGSRLLFGFKNRLYYQDGDQLIVADPGLNVASNTGHSIGNLFGDDKICINEDESFALIPQPADGQQSELAVFDGENLRVVSDFGSDQSFRAARILGAFENRCFVSLVRVSLSSSEYQAEVLGTVNFDAETIDLLDVEAIPGSYWQKRGDVVFINGWFDEDTQGVMRLNPAAETLELVQSTFSESGGFEQVGDTVYFHVGPYVYAASPDFSVIEQIIQHPNGIGFESYSNASFISVLGNLALIFSDNMVWVSEGTEATTSVLFAVPGATVLLRSPYTLSQITASGTREVLPGLLNNLFQRNLGRGGYQPVILTSQPGLGQSISGDWVTAELRDQGLIISTGEHDDGAPFIFLAWFIHRDGKPYWLVGNIDFAYSDASVTVPLVEVSSLNALQPDPNQVGDRETVGEVTLSMNSCDVLQVDYALDDSGWGSLLMEKLLGPIERSFCFPVSN